MNLIVRKFHPWNWFKNENEESRRPVRGRREEGNEGFYPSQLWSLHEGIDKMFENTFHHFGLPMLGLGASGNFSKENILRPHINIDATDKEYRITIEVPGVEEKDIKIEIDQEGILKIQGEKSREKEEKGREYYCIERSYGSFERALSLPEDAEQGNVNARFKNGVLTVAIPRKTLSKSKVRQIPIETVDVEKEG